MQNSKKTPQGTDCTRCWNYEEDAQTGCGVCRFDLDEDEMGGFLAGRVTACPYFRFNDEYEVVRKQN